MNDLNACIFDIQRYSIHDGPGIRTVVFFKGCPLRCKWCSNPESQSLLPQEVLDDKNIIKLYGTYKTIDYVMEEVIKDKPFYEESNGGVTLSGGEVLLQKDFAIELLKRLKQENIHRACETTGYTNPENFNEFLQHIDLLLFDLKHYDSQVHLQATGIHNETILENLKIAVNKGIETIIRIPVIPGVNDSLKDAEGFCRLLKSIGVYKVNLLPFHQYGENKYKLLNMDYSFKNVPQLREEDLQQYKKIFINKGLVCLI